MTQLLRYALAVVVGVVATGLAALDSQSAVLLTGVFVIFTMTAAILWEYPELVWGDGLDESHPSGVLAGGTTFGTLMLAQGLGVEFHYAAGVFGFGLVAFGAACGVWLSDESTAAPA
ncbi:hypothetical protein [Haloarchaeobius sp. DFWS5]|uniref:hypothetical protein n=1 Tax=Haloarchaeobius sp. DFWS5 TaxID=3446114 RepID=UPI003EB98A52